MTLIPSIGETLSAFDLLDEVGTHFPDNFESVLYVTLIGEIIGLLIVVFSILFIVAVFMRKSTFLLFDQISYLALFINVIFAALIPSIMLGFEYMALETFSGTIGTLIGSAAGFFLLTLYYCKSVRVRTYMRGIEYMKQAIFAYK